MKQVFYQSVLLMSTAALLASCGNKEAAKTLPPQGKVKLESISIAPKIAGKIETILVQEGQQVHKGDTLAIIAVPEITAKLEQAEGAITAAAGQLDLAHNGATVDQLMQIQSQVEAAQAQMDFAAQSFNRVSNMYHDSLVPAQQYDDAKSKYNMAKAQVKVLKAKQQEVQSGTRKETIQSAAGQLQRARGARNEVLQAAKERFIISPANMMIESINLHPGELATPGYNIITGTDNNSIYFRFTIGENAINAYAIAQPLNIAVTNTNKTITAKIVAVKQMPRYADNTSTSPNRQVGEGFYELKVAPQNAADAAGLFNNSTVFIKQ